MRHVPQEPPKKTAESSLEALLKQYATSTQEAPVFQTEAHAKGKESASGAAKNVWLAVLSRLQEDRHFLLYHGLKEQENYKLEHKTLTLSVKDAAGTALLTPENVSVVNGAIQSVMGKEYAFVLAGKEGGNAPVRRDPTSLLELFGDKFTDKTKK
jgi:hypothetical protein